jgi:hypothetical protein
MNEQQWRAELLRLSGLPVDTAQVPYVGTAPPLHPDAATDYDQRRLAACEAALGPADMTYRVPVGAPTIDVYRFPPNAERRCWVWITSGMSDFPQCGPEGEALRTELALTASAALEAAPELLRTVGEFPFRAATHVDVFHTLRLPAEQRPPGFFGVLFMPPVHLQALDSIDIGAPQPVNLLQLLPITLMENATARMQGGLAVLRGLPQVFESFLFDRAPADLTPID